MQHNDNLLRKRIILLSCMIGIVTAVWCCQILAFPSFRSFNVVDQIKSVALNTTISNINPKVLNLALKAYENAKKAGIGKRDILTIVDYSLPSNERRLWVIDMSTKKVLHNTHVAHGSGSGDKFATKFSNRHGSRMSSLGLYLTGDIYTGNHGTSLNLFGLEDKFNSNAHARRIVVHKAYYVNENVIKQIGRSGRSFGCLALNDAVANKIMHDIKHGSLVFCYYPDSEWLQQSKLLGN
jgi:hypothetical protein